MLYIYLIAIYAFATISITSLYEEQGVLKINDLLMYILAPFSFVPVLFVFILSRIIDLDAVVFKKEDE